jgi:transposase InsO family protein
MLAKAGRSATTEAGGSTFAMVLLEQWRRHFNEVRPHSSLGYLTPNEFVARERAAPG